MSKNYDFESQPPISESASFDFTRYLRRLLPRWIARVRTGRLPVLQPPARPMPDQGTPPIRHQHPMPEMVFQLSGCVRYVFPTGQILLHPGSACLIPARIPHRELGILMRSASPSYNVIFSHYLSDLIEIHLGSTDASTDRPRVLARCYVRANDNERHVWNLQTLADILKRKPPAWRDHSMGLLLSYLCAMLDLLQTPLSQIRHFNEKVSACIHLMATHLDDPALSARLLAEWLHCSPNYLSTVFRQATGRRIREMIIEKRIVKARELLHDPRLTIKEVAFAVGFCRPGYFIRVFKQKNQCTPRAWRQIQQTEPPSRKP